MPGSWENLISNILSLYYYNKVQIARLFHNVSRTMLKHIAYTYPFTTRQGPGMPGPPPCRYCNLIFHIVGRGLAPPPHIAFIVPYSRQVAHVGAAYMPPAPPSHHNPLYLSPSTATIYTLPKNRSQNLSKNPKKLLTRVILLAIIIKLSRGGHAAKSAS